MASGLELESQPSCGHDGGAGEEVHLLGSGVLPYLNTVFGTCSFKEPL